MSEPTIASLQDRLSQATEHKAPSEATTNVVWFADETDIEETPPTGTTANQKTEQNQTTQTQQTNTPGANPTTETKTDTGTTKLPDTVIKQSAETAVLMYGQALEVCFTLVANSKLNKKFTAEEKKVIIDKDLEFTEEEKLLDEAEKTLSKKWKYYTKKHKRTLAEIPLKEDEEKRLTDAFYNVFKVKNITMPPEYLLLANLLFTTTDRIVDAVID